MSRDIESSTESFGDIGPRATPTLPGWVVIVVLGVIGFLGAGGAWLYHLSTQRRPVDFWGYDSHRIVATAPNVIVSLIEPEPKFPEPKTWHDGLFIVGEDRYAVVDQKPAEKFAGFERTGDAALRRYLRHDDSYDWQSLVLTRPTWRYALSFAQTDKMYEGTDHEEDRPFSFTLVFDAECKYVRLQMVDKTAILQPPIAAEFARMFRKAFPGSSIPAGRLGPAASGVPPNSLPTSTAMPHVGGSGMAIIPAVPAPAATATPTSTPTPSATPTPTPSATVSSSAAPMAVPGPTVLSTPKPSATPTPSPSPTPSASKTSPTSTGS